jgi:hypothetical protein
MGEDIGTETVTAISNRLLMPAWPGMRRMTPDEIRERDARRKEEWDANTTAGLVGINRAGEDKWERADRNGYVERWVSSESWDRYLAALGALTAAEADLA